MTYQINSSAIREVTYFANEEKLSVTFTSGKVYDYLRVTTTLIEGLLNATSAGAFFNRNIRPLG